MLRSWGVIFEPLRSHFGARSGRLGRIGAPWRVLGQPWERLGHPPATLALGLPLASQEGLRGSVDRF